MDGNLFIKIARAAYSIAERPLNFNSYLSSQFSTPLSLGLPWISYPAIDFLERYLRPEMDVFEFGSGGSTVYFSSRVGSVTAVEEDAKWATLVEAELKKTGSKERKCFTQQLEFQGRPRRLSPIRLSYSFAK